MEGSGELGKCICHSEVVRELVWSKLLNVRIRYVCFLLSSRLGYCGVLVMEEGVYGGL